MLGVHHDPPGKGTWRCVSELLSRSGFLLMRQIVGKGEGTSYSNTQVPRFAFLVASGSDVPLATFQVNDAVLVEGAEGVVHY
jgi:hypothetical protein